jgi:hypothetical protein
VRPGHLSDQQPAVHAGVHQHHSFAPLRTSVETSLTAISLNDSLYNGNTLRGNTIKKTMPLFRQAQHKGRRCRGILRQAVVVSLSNHQDKPKPEDAIQLNPSAGRRGEPVEPSGQAPACPTPSRTSSPRR